MEYYQRTVKFIARVIEDLRKNAMGKVKDFHRGILCINDQKGLDEKGMMR